MKYIIYSDEKDIYIVNCDTGIEYIYPTLENNYKLSPGFERNNYKIIRVHHADYFEIVKANSLLQASRLIPSELFL